jgi:3-oxoacyl-[acyl-carrier-protein] synthase I
MSEPISIVSDACRCAVGLLPETAAAAVRAGIIRIADHPYMVDQAGAPVRVAIEPTVPEDAYGTARLVALTTKALAQLVERTPVLAQAQGPVLVLLAVPEHRPGFGPADEAQVLAAARAVRPGLDVRIAARGHAGGLHALLVGQQLLERRQAQLVIVGGVESYLHGDTLDWLAQHRQLQADDTRAGFFPGEAAGFVVLMGESLRRACRLPARAVLRGGHSEQETALIKTDAVNLAKALTAAIRGAAAHLRPGELCDEILCDINGERYRTDEWSTTLLRIPGLLRHGSGRPADYESPSRSWGDVGAASGILLCVLAIAAWRRGYAQGERTLLFAGSEQGLRTAVVLQAPGER